MYSELRGARQEQRLSPVGRYVDACQAANDDMAERQGFEPWEGFPSTVFKTAAFDHSATSPDVFIHYCVQLLISDGN